MHKCIFDTFMSFYKIGFYKFFLSSNKMQKNSTSNIIQTDKLNTIVWDKTLYLKEFEKSFKFKFPLNYGICQNIGNTLPKRFLGFHRNLN